MFKIITKYINFIDSLYELKSESCLYNKVFRNNNYKIKFFEFYRSICMLAESHPELESFKYKQILKSSDIQYSQNYFDKICVRDLDAHTVYIILFSITRAERFCDGVVLHFISNGLISRCLHRLKYIDQLTESDHRSSKAFSMLLGVAIGDALGVPVEFLTRGFPKVDDFIPFYGVHEQPAGTWSEDTSLTLALADNMSVYPLNLNNVAKSFIDWLYNAKYSANGTVFDVCETTVILLIIDADVFLVL